MNWNVVAEYFPRFGHEWQVKVRRESKRDRRWDVGASLFSLRSHLTYNSPKRKRGKPRLRFGLVK